MPADVAVHYQEWTVYGTDNDDKYTIVIRNNLIGLFGQTKQLCRCIAKLYG